MKLAAALRALTILAFVTACLTPLAPPAGASTERTISFSISVGRTTAGKSVTMTGKVSPPRRGTYVIVERKAATRWKTVTKIRATRLGTYTYDFRPSTTGATTYRVRAPKLGLLRAGTSRTRTLVVDRKTTASLGASDSTPTTTDTVTFSGRVRPFRVGTRVILQRRIGNTWVNDGKPARVKDEGRYAFNRRALSGKWSYRAKVLRVAAAFLAETKSRTTTIDVRGPSTFMVEIINVPEGMTPNVVVRFPNGSTATPVQTTTYADASPGVWHVESAPLVDGDQAFWPIMPSQEIPLGREASQVALVDYSVVTPTTTKAVTDQQHVEAEADEADPSLIHVKVSDAGSAAQRQTHAILRRHANRQASSSFGTCLYQNGDNVAFTASSAFPKGALGTVSNASCDPLGVSLFNIRTGSLTVTYADMIGEDINAANRDPLAFRLSGDDTVATGNKFYRSINGFTLSERNKHPERVKSSRKKVTATQPCEAGGSIGLSGDLEIRPILEIDPQWGPWNDLGLKSLHARVAIDQSSELTVTADAHVSCSNKQTPLGTLHFAPMVFTVGIPIVMTPRLDLSTKVSLEADARGSFSIKEVANASREISWTPTSGIQPGTNTQSISIDSAATRESATITGSVSGEAALRADLKFTFNAVAHATAYAEASATAHATTAVVDGSPSIAWGISPKARAGAMFGFDVFGWGVQSPEYDIVSWCGPPIASGGWNDPNQPVINTESLPPAPVGVPYSFQLQSTNGTDPGSWSVSGPLPPGLSLSPSGMLSGTPTAAGATTLTFTYSDKCGRVTGKSLNLLGTEPSNAWSKMGLSALSATCGIRTDNSAACWGLNDYGQTGNGTFGMSARENTPQPLPGTWTTISTEGRNTCGVRTDHTGWCWGINSSGTVGDATTTTRPDPTQLPGLWKTIEVSHGTACGMRTDNSGWCWGSNSWGQVGDGGTASRSTPQQLPGSWQSISRYSTTTCGVRADSTGWCWGENSYGELGDGTTTSRSVPTQVAGNWKSITVDAMSTCGIRTDDTGWCWGYNALGSVGDATTANALTPQQLPGTWTSLHPSSRTTCGIRTDASAWCWGYNNHGQVGNGTTTDVLAPFQLTGEWTQVRTYGQSTCGIRTDQTASCWGGNNFGQLGNGTTADASSPAPLPGQWRFIWPGGSSTCGIRATGSAQCWGNNGNGSLGDGTYTQRLEPVDVVS